MAQELVMEIKQKSTEKGVAAQYDKTVPIGVLAENVLFEDGSNLTDNLNVYVFQDKSDQGYSSLIDSDSLQTITHSFRGSYLSFEQLQRFFINKTCILKSYFDSNHFQLFLLDYVTVPYDNGIRLVSSPVKSKLPSAQLFNLQVWVTLDIPAASDTIECTYTFVKYTVTHTAPGEMTQNQYNRLFNYIQNGNSYIRDTSQNGKVWCVGTGGSASGVPGWRDIPAVSTSEAGIVPVLPQDKIGQSGSYVFRSSGDWQSNIKIKRLAQQAIDGVDQGDGGLINLIDSNTGEPCNKDDFPFLLLVYKTGNIHKNTLLIRPGWLDANFTNRFWLTDPIGQKYWVIYYGGLQSINVVIPDAAHKPSSSDRIAIYGLY